MGVWKQGIQRESDDKQRIVASRECKKCNESIDKYPHGFSRTNLDKRGFCVTYPSHNIGKEVITITHRWNKYKQFRRGVIQKFTKNKLYSVKFEEWTSKNKKRNYTKTVKCNTDLVCVDFVRDYLWKKLYEHKFDDSK